MNQSSCYLHPSLLNKPFSATFVASVIDIKPAITNLVEIFDFLPGQRVNRRLNIKGTEATKNAQALLFDWNGSEISSAYVMPARLVTRNASQSLCSCLPSRCWPTRSKISQYLVLHGRRLGVAACRGLWRLSDQYTHF